MNISTQTVYFVLLKLKFSWYFSGITMFGEVEEKMDLNPYIGYLVKCMNALLDLYINDSKESKGVL